MWRGAKPCRRRMLNSNSRVSPPQRSKLKAPSRQKKWPIKIAETVVIRPPALADGLYVLIGRLDLGQVERAAAQLRRRKSAWMPSSRTTMIRTSSAAMDETILFGRGEVCLKFREVGPSIMNDYHLLRR
jgi:hypothetical protein